MWQHSKYQSGEAGCKDGGKDWALSWGLPETDLPHSRATSLQAGTPKSGRSGETTIPTLGGWCNSAPQESAEFGDTNWGRVLEIETLVTDRLSMERGWRPGRLKGLTAFL